ncbi:hypothetical protein PHYSODRAFT_496581 [Phytophthora sojae]|uniref:Uncharacterized protein n=1 Tax=Phytophthora sojae (strain P6497) TaxID=1094619 RepID=G4ZBA9_PHYSP|nr:hypothetical protein PHYSODRAFT_496581 [Phytophthora sojae]EGZ22705.1 hypothetical protein PHYSODRAFT_496581 [Phytophthora sojae]|eukprot:XP_009525422.1 hypothetical protein PHYSODRAFT_496581 [Phytophthora sojae]
MTTLAQSSQLLPSASGSHREAEMTPNGEPATKRPYLGKCQYKTGKCVNERTLKRNGDAHSLCEEHRIKQNLIQRRSDRKYQKEHAIRRRERSQRRAALKKRVSIAVAQQLFIENQQQHNTFGFQYDAHAYANSGDMMAAGFAGVAPRIRVPQPSAAFVQEHQSSVGSPLVLSFSNMEATPLARTTGFQDELSPSGIDNFAPYSFQSALGDQNLPTRLYSEMYDSRSAGYTPIDSSLGDKQTWSDDDIELLQAILLV